MSLKLLLEFGSNIKKDVVWDKDLMSFPKVVSYKLSTWEWAIWDRDEVYDYKLYFKQIKEWDTNLPIPDIDEMFQMSYVSRTDCECGAKYDRHAPNEHSDWCKVKKR